MQQVNILESGRALTLMLTRAAVAAVAAGAGALGSAGIGDDAIQAGQWAVAIGAAAAAFGGVIGVPQQHITSEAPDGELQKIRQPDTSQLQVVDGEPGTRRARRQRQETEGQDNGPL